MTNSAISLPAYPDSRLHLLAESTGAPVWCRADPNTFIQYCFRDPGGRRIRQAELHRELQEFLSGQSRALVELPRDHGKSFQVCCRIVWELGLRPGLRVKIVCATEAIAAERARFVRDAIARNEWVKSVFPNLKPASPWAAGGFTIERLSPVIGPSVAAYGINGGNTGTRADLLVCDDVVDVSALHSRIDRLRVAEYFENNLMNLLEPDGRFWGLFTPWHADDLNARLKKNPAFSLFRRPIGEDFEPIWDAKWPRERLVARKTEIGSASFARGYRLVPLADDETLIRPDWVRYWTAPAEYHYRVLSVDPAVSTSAKADRSALVVLGRTADPNPPPPFPEKEGGGCLGPCTPFPGREAGWGVRSPQIDVLEATARRVAAPDLVALIDDCDRRWNPEVILFESNAAFLGIKDLLARHARFGAKVKGVTQSSDKGARFAAFSVSVENGSFRLKGDGGEVDAGQRELFEEMTAFPFGDRDDLVDAAATGWAYLSHRREPRIWG